MIDKKGVVFRHLERGSKRVTLLRVYDGERQGPYGSSFFRLCCLNWFVMKIRPSWKSVSETMALAMPMPWPRIHVHAKDFPGMALWQACAGARLVITFIN